MGVVHGIRRSGIPLADSADGHNHMGYRVRLNQRLFLDHKVCSTEEHMRQVYSFRSEMRACVDSVLSMKIYLEADGWRNWRHPKK